MNKGKERIKVRNREKLREEIDNIDDALVNLLAKRMKIAKKIGTMKVKEKMPIYDNKREEDIYRRVIIQAKKKNISERMIRAIYEEIITASREVQRGKNHESFKKNQ
ncbi:chorismate mutase [Candidatus Woesearchaeota archaeon]|nr:chorismate mutase [Candidatus Woesearchaeota archaeon]